MKVLGCGIWAAVGLLGLCLAGAAEAQESLDQGKSAAQLFASDCVICHKAPQGLARGAGPFGLDSFLQEHYTSSRETATALANYLKAMNSGPASPGRASKRTTGEDKTKAGEKKRPGPQARAAEPKASPPKRAEPRPAGILAPEPKSPAPAGEPNPVESGRSD